MDTSLVPLNSMNVREAPSVRGHERVSRKTLKFATKELHVQELGKN